tara:strand:+ start:116 stop:520 length:405 start_codon:yes stop_codon:yes gene_type:complete
MKVKEYEVIDILRSVKKNIQPCEYEYNRFDAEDEKNIYEIKVRSKLFKDTFIEFDKYSYNTMYAQEFNKIFIYVVKMENTIYLFNVSLLYMRGYDFNWELKKLNRNTEFNQTEKIQKIVGYINTDEAIYTIDCS